MARRSSRLREQAAAPAQREPDVVALQEVTARTLPLWRAALETTGLAGVRTSLDHADQARDPAAQRRTGVLLSSRTSLADALALPVPWPETAVAAVASPASTGLVELHCVHVPNAANGWVKVRTLEAIRRGLANTLRIPRVLCGDLNTPRRELPDGEVMSFARGSRGRLRPERGAEWDEAELGIVPGLRELPRCVSDAARLRAARAELDLAAYRRARRRLAPGSPLRLGGASPHLSLLPPCLAGGGAERPRGAGCRPAPLTGS